MNYWRDIGTLDAYWEANMDLVAVDPQFNLYDQHWPIRTYQGNFLPPSSSSPRIFRGGRWASPWTPSSAGLHHFRRARAELRVVAACTRVHDHADVRESVVMENVVIGEHARIRRAIIDKDVIIPPKTVIGSTRSRIVNVSKSPIPGLVVISKGMKLHAAVDPSG